MHVRVVRVQPFWIESESVRASEKKLYQTLHLFHLSPTERFRASCCGRVTHLASMGRPISPLMARRAVAPPNKSEAQRTFPMHRAGLFWAFAFCRHVGVAWRIGPTITTGGRGGP